MMTPFDTSSCAGALVSGAGTRLSMRTGTEENGKEWLRALSLSLGPPPMPALVGLVVKVLGVSGHKGAVQTRLALLGSRIFGYRTTSSSSSVGPGNAADQHPAYGGQFVPESDEVAPLFILEMPAWALSRVEGNDLAFEAVNGATGQVLSCTVVKKDAPQVGRWLAAATRAHYVASLTSEASVLQESSPAQLKYQQELEESRARRRCGWLRVVIGTNKEEVLFAVLRGTGLYLYPSEIASCQEYGVPAKVAVPLADAQITVHKTDAALLRLVPSGDIAPMVLQTGLVSSASEWQQSIALATKVATAARDAAIASPRQREFMRGPMTLNGTKKAKEFVLTSHELRWLDAKGTLVGAVQLYDCIVRQIPSSNKKEVAFEIVLPSGKSLTFLAPTESWLTALAKAVDSKRLAEAPLPNRVFGVHSVDVLDTRALAGRVVRHNAVESPLISWIPPLPSPTASTAFGLPREFAVVEECALFLQLTLNTWVDEEELCRVVCGEDVPVHLALYFARLFDEGHMVKIDVNVDPAVATFLLVKFLTELEETVLTDALVRDFLVLGALFVPGSVPRLTAPEDVDMLRALVDSLPASSSAILSVLARVWRLAARRVGLFQVTETYWKAVTQASEDDEAAASAVVGLLTNHQEELWPNASKGFADSAGAGSREASGTDVEAAAAAAAASVAAPPSGGGEGAVAGTAAGGNVYAQLPDFSSTTALDLGEYGAMPDLVPGGNGGGDGEYGAAPTSDSDYAQVTVEYGSVAVPSTPAGAGAPGKAGAPNVVLPVVDQYASVAVPSRSAARAAAEPRGKAQAPAGLDALVSRQVKHVQAAAMAGNGAPVRPTCGVCLARAAEVKATLANGRTILLCSHCHGRKMAQQKRAAEQRRRLGEARRKLADRPAGTLRGGGRHSARMRKLNIAAAQSATLTPPAEAAEAAAAGEMLLSPRASAQAGTAAPEVFVRLTVPDTANGVKVTKTVGVMLDDTVGDVSELIRLRVPSVPDWSERRLVLDYDAQCGALKLTLGLREIVDANRAARKTSVPPGAPVFLAMTALTKEERAERQAPQSVASRASLRRSGSGEASRRSESPTPPSPTPAVRATSKTSSRSASPTGSVSSSPQPMGMVPPAAVLAKFRSSSFAKGPLDVEPIEEE